MPEVYTPHIGRMVYLRDTLDDEQVWADTFTGLYHVPPREMRAPDSVLDLGANIGLTCAHFQYLWPDARVVAVEMDERNARMIPRNAPGVPVAQRAVAAVPGVGYYDLDAHTDAYALGAGSEPVRCATLDSLILEHLGGTCDFVKMDIEGAEWEVLTDSDWWAPRVQHLLVELHGPLGNEEAIALAIGCLSRAGFHAVPHTPHPRSVYATKEA